MSSTVDTTTTTRRLVFICHATPEDNPLTIWLHAHLVAEGYSVWADVEKLRGGDPFWADIQDAIRTNTARFLMLVSRTSVKRNGVLTELQEASNVSSRLGDSRFIIPIKVDDLPWNEFPIQVARFNGIDFSEDWALSLLKLLEALDRDKIPRESGPGDVARVCGLYSRSRSALRDVPERGLANWLEVTALPETVYYSHAANASESELRSQRKAINVPHEQHGRLVISFVESSVVAASFPPDLGLAARYQISLDSFLADQTKSVPELGRNVARNFVSSIVRQGWESFLQVRGLKQHDKTRWFIPVAWVSNNKARFRRVDGTETYRALVGKAKNHTWHFAIASKVLLYPFPRIQITPHVLFSGDGITPYADQKQLRRRHCKLWWNDAWRDRLLATLITLFGEDGEDVKVSLGCNAFMTIRRQLFEFQLPVTYSPADTYIPSEDEIIESGGCLL